MRIIVMGSSEFALPALKNLIKNYDVIAVYTQKAKPAGRGMKLKPTPIEVYAKEHGVPVFTPVNFKNLEDIEQFRTLNADMAIVAAYGLILPKIILDAPQLGCLNIHGSLLPRWRGAAPIHRALMAGDTKTGVTIMKMSEGLDEGDVYDMRSIDLQLSDTTGIIHDKLSEIGGELLIEVIEKIKSNMIEPYQQDHALANYAHKITKQESLLEYQDLDANSVIRKINALNPFPSAYIIYQGYRLKIHKAEIVDQSGSAGTITEDLILFCKEKAIRPLIVQKEGRQKQSIKDFLNGVKNNQGSHK